MATCSNQVLLTQQENGRVYLIWLTKMELSCPDVIFMQWLSDFKIGVGAQQCFELVPNIFLGAQQCFESVSNIFLESAPSLCTVRNWFCEFKRRRNSLEDDLHCGHPNTIMIEDIDAGKKAYPKRSSYDISWSRNSPGHWISCCTNNHSWSFSCQEAVCPKGVSFTHKPTEDKQSWVEPIHAV